MGQGEVAFQAFVRVMSGWILFHVAKGSCQYTRRRARGPIRQANIHISSDALRLQSIYGILINDKNAEIQTPPWCT